MPSDRITQLLDATSRYAGEVSAALGGQPQQGVDPHTAHHPPAHSEPHNSQYHAQKYPTETCSQAYRTGTPPPAYEDDYQYQQRVSQSHHTSSQAPPYHQSENHQHSSQSVPHTSQPAENHHSSHNGHTSQSSHTENHPTHHSSSQQQVEKPGSQRIQPTKYPVNPDHPGRKSKRDRVIDKLGAHLCG